MKKWMKLASFLALISLTGCKLTTERFVEFDDFFVNRPLWSVYIFTLVAILGSISIGYRYAQNRKRKFEGKEETSLGPVVSGLMGLLAFILAFTFGLSNNRFNERKDLMLQEVAAIETAYYRTALLPPENGTQIRKHLREYVEIRLKVFSDKILAAEVIRESELMKKKIWGEIMDLSEVSLKNPVMFSLMLGSVNDMFNLHTKRITVGTVYHLPAVLWIALYLLVIFTMLGVGYTVGQGQRTNRIMMLVFAFGFSSIILLIADLDHGGKNNAGFIRVNPKPMLDLSIRMAANP